MSAFLWAPDAFVLPPICGNHTDSDTEISLWLYIFASRGCRCLTGGDV